MDFTKNGSVILSVDKVTFSAHESQLNGPVLCVHL